MSKPKIADVVRASRSATSYVGRSSAVLGPSSLIHVPLSLIVALPALIEIAKAARKDIAQCEKCHLAQAEMGDDGNCYDHTYAASALFAVDWEGVDDE